MEFNKITSLKIKEGNVVSIADKDNNTLWYAEKYAYGIRWNSNVPDAQATTACERIGNLELHKTLPIQSKFACCVHKEGNILYWCHPDDSRFRKDTTGYLFDSIKLLIDTPVPGGSQAAVVSDYSPDKEFNYVMTPIDTAYESNAEIKLLLTTYKYRYGFIKIDDVVCRVNKIDTDNATLYLSTTGTLTTGNKAHKLELGCSINGYDGEIGVYTPKFYIWSKDNDGDNNEVWMSEHKCTSYARLVKPHIIGLNRCPVLNTVMNDEKWGYLNTLKANTAVDVINYMPNLRGGNNNNNYDQYLTSDTFRTMLCKCKSQIPLATMRTASRANGGQVLYYQIWSAVVWCYIVEYADFNIKKAYNSSLTSEGYHQGGLGNNLIAINSWPNYNAQTPIVTNDFTLELGNNTGIKTKAAYAFKTATPANTTWKRYTVTTANTYSIDTTNTIINFTKITNVAALQIAGTLVSGTHKYKIEGISDTTQNIVFRGREGKGDLTITSDGTYDIEWGHSNTQRYIRFTATQETCNIKITIVEAPASYTSENQRALNVAHYRGFNVFWYGDAWLNIENFLSKHNGTNRVFYITEDPTKFSNSVNDKELQFTGLKNESENWLKEITVSKVGNIIPNKLSSSANYKNAWHWNYTNTSIHTTYVGGCSVFGGLCGLLFLNCHNAVGRVYSDCAFAKCFILK